MADHAFFAVVTYSKISLCAYINLFVINHLQYLIFKNFFMKIVCHLFVYNFISAVI